MERETGIEPATSSLGSWRSTAELLPLSNEMKHSTYNKTFSIRVKKMVQIIIPREPICKERLMLKVAPQ
jgi:hypothetical protein